MPSISALNPELPSTLVRDHVTLLMYPDPAVVVVLHRSFAIPVEICCLLLYVVCFVTITCSYAVHTCAHQSRASMIQRGFEENYWEPKEGCKKYLYWLTSTGVSCAHVSRMCIIAGAFTVK